MASWPKDILDTIKAIDEIWAWPLVKAYLYDPVAAGGWPALVLVLIIALVLAGVIILVISEFTLRNVQYWLNQWPSLMTLAVVSAFAAGGWVYIFGNKRISWWAFLPTLVSTYLFRRLYAQLPPDDKLVVAIVPFRAIGTDEKEAQVMCHRIARNLVSKKNKGVPVEIKEIFEETKGNSTDERRHEAKRLGKQNRAHIVLWGELFQDQIETICTIRLDVVTNLGTARLEERSIPEFFQAEPDCLEFKKRVASEVADIVTLVYALGYYQANDLKKAMALLEHVPTREGRFYMGLCLSRIAEESRDPRQEYEREISIYSEVLEENSSESMEEKDG